MPRLRLRFWLPLASVGVLAGSLGVLAWSVVTPCQVDVSPVRHHVDAASAPVDEPTRLSLEGFEPLFGRAFQAPLYDPPPPKPPPKVERVIPPPPVKLLATMPEPGGGYAMFSDQSNAILIKAVGEQVISGDSPVEVVEIADDHVVLRHEGRLVTLTPNTK